MTSKTEIKTFTIKTTGDEVVDAFAEYCHKKVVIVTGANTGIGFETARCLASKGAKVILACRNKELGGSAVARILKAQPDADVYFLELDLGSLNSINHFVKLFLAKFKILNILINNAVLYVF